MDINKIGLIPNWVRNFVSASVSYSQTQTQSYSLNVNGPLQLNIKIDHCILFCFELVNYEYIFGIVINIDKEVCQQKIRCC